MTTRIYLAIFLLTFSITASAQSVTRTFNKSFNADNLGTVMLDLPGEIDYKVWDNPYLKIEIGITIASGNGAILNELANIGRYNLVAKSVGDKLVITAPNTQRQLKVKGEELREDFSYTVFIPENMKIEIPQVTAEAEAKK